MSKNSIEYNLTNKLFSNCKKRIIIDINDNEDIQITSHIEPKVDNHCLIKLEDNENLPKELKFDIKKGRKGKIQFRAYSLDKKEESLRNTLTELFDDNKMDVQIQRQLTNYFNPNTNQQRTNRLRNRNQLNNNDDQQQQQQQQTQIQTRSRGRSLQRNSRVNTTATNNDNQSVTNQVNKKQQTTTSKSTTTTTTAATAKRARSTSKNDDDETTNKRKKVAHNQESNGNNKSKRNVSKGRSNSKGRKTQKQTTAKAKKAATNKKSTKAAAKTTQQATTASAIKIKKQSSIELIDLASSTVDSEGTPVTSSQQLNNEAEMEISNLVDNLGEQIVNELNQSQNINNDDDQQSLNLAQEPNNTSNQDKLARYSNLIDNLMTNNLNTNQQKLNRQSSTTSSESNRLNSNKTTTSSQEANDLMKKYFDYQEIERRLNRMREQKNELTNRKTTTIAAGLTTVTANNTASKTKADQERKQPSVYFLNDNLASINNRLGQKHLIICLTIILIGELVHYLQPKSKLNYDQLPIGCLPISNLINSLQFTIIGHLLFKFTNLLAPSLFRIFRTTSRLICYCLFLFFSYGLLRKSLTNWVLNNNKSIKLLPINVTICSSMLILYSIVALFFSTDNSRIVKKRKSTVTTRKQHQNDLLDQISQDDLFSVEKLANHNWLNSIINILTPFIVIGPLIGTNIVRLYNVPKALLAASALIYLVGLYKYLVGRLERTNLKQHKLMVYELKPNTILFSKSTSKVRFLTYFGALLIITAYNLLVLNLWSFLLEILAIVYLKLKSKNLDNHFNQMNKQVHNKYKNNNPYTFNSWIH